MINRQVLPCFISESQISSDEKILLELVKISEYETWLRKQDEFSLNWLITNNYKIKPYTFCLMPNQQGKIARVLVGCEDDLNLWSLSHLPKNVPVGFYALSSNYHEQWEKLALGWGLGAYQYDAFKKPEREAATLIIPNEQSLKTVQSQLQAIYLVRDLINTPAESMGPAELSFAAQALAKHYQAEFTEIIGNELVSKNFPAVYIVGRGSAREPRLLDIRWGDDTHPKVTLVGKGVCFDSGGLDIKTSAGMLLMKKDMGGAAHALGLASLIMDANLPIRLRVLIPAVENFISGTAYRPGDVIQTRKGLTVEIGNTDAEGRVILSDALAEASTESPELIIDFATLTGAARVATGTDIPAMFSNHQITADALFRHSKNECDLVWQMPLHQPYKELIKSEIADLNNNSGTPYAGAITAALFLESFVEETIPWVHFDLMAYNELEKPGRPKGGEAMGLRAVFRFLEEKYNL